MNSNQREILLMIGGIASAVASFRMLRDARDELQSKEEQGNVDILEEVFKARGLRHNADLAQGQLIAALNEWDEDREHGVPSDAAHAVCQLCKFADNVPKQLEEPSQETKRDAFEAMQRELHSFTEDLDEHLERPYTEVRDEILELGNRCFGLMAEFETPQENAG